ncbi:hypothetical protein LAUMK4_05897 [Mycobacterium persicum]|uniref:Alanine and proline rich membrane protein n=1 Tax=Mycobacterium persicum TaxID=1487726 RepID=A0ABY6RSP4_9MYCO|nr:hypothetical protein LAUMK4_05897 [Mycobacterium persicum]
MAPPQALEPVPFYRPPRRPGWLTVSVTLALAVLLALGAAVMSAIKLTAPTPAATTTTVTAAPPAPPSYSQEQVAAAKKEACDASYVAAPSVNTAQGNYLSVAGDRQSPQYGPALANFQLVVGLETQYMQQHLPPATPTDVAAATNDYITALLALADAHTRGLSTHDAQPFVMGVRDAGAQLNKVCE